MFFFVHVQKRQLWTNKAFINVIVTTDIYIYICNNNKTVSECYALINNEKYRCICSNLSVNREAVC